MKKTITLLALTLITTTIFAQGTWTPKANFTGAARAYSPIGFAIGTKGYVGLGGNGSFHYQDLVEWNSANDTWTPKTNFFNLRELATSFVIGDKGYAGTGNLVTTNYGDIWQYDTTSNAWTQMASIPGTARVLCVSFSINGKGYLGSGGFAATSTVYYNDFYEYDPTLNTWTAKATFPTIGRTGASGFAINGKGYIALGNRSGNLNDVWEYDPLLDTWTQKGNFTGVARNVALSFVIGNYAYVGGGYDGSSDRQDFYQYEPVADLWVPKANLGGGTRVSGTAYAINGKGYIACGRFNGSNSNTYYEYDPNMSVGVTEQSQQETFSIYPNPFTTTTTITFKAEQKNTVVKISDLLGKEIKTVIFTGRQLVIDKAEMKAGIYFVQTTDQQKHIYNTKIIIQ